MMGRRDPVRDSPRSVAAPGAYDSRKIDPGRRTDSGEIGPNHGTILARKVPMRIDCPACAAVYEVPDTILTSGPRALRCVQPRRRARRHR